MYTMEPVVFWYHHVSCSQNIVIKGKIDKEIFIAHTVQIQLVIRAHKIIPNMERKFANLEGKESY